MGLNLQTDWYEVSGNEIRPGPKHPYPRSISATWEISGRDINRGMGHPAGYSPLPYWEIQSDGTVQRTAFHPQGSSISSVGLD